jgi:GGDEF domain-containing protein
MMLCDQEFRTTASVGIAMFPDDGSDEATLTKHADTAMYAAASIRSAAESLSFR